MSYVTNDKCLLCSGAVREVLKLTPTPPANCLETIDGEPSATYPLDLMLCESCGHLQLGVSVDPEILFRDYAYVSPKGMQEHWRRHAAQMIPRFSLKHGDLVVDIGSNSGDLLSYYRDAGMHVLGVEPAEQIATGARNRGVDTVTAFFSTNFANTYVNVRGAKLVCMNNAFAHIRDLRDIVGGVKTILSDDGVFIFEVAWRGATVENCDFANVYHEHIHYHAVKPLRDFLESCDMRLFDVQAIDTHNGSIRCFAKWRSIPGGPKVEFEHVEDFINREMFNLGLFGEITYTGLHVRIERARYEFRQLFDALVWGPINAGGVAPKVAVLGCPAKLTTMAYHLGLGPHEVAYVCDDEPRKIGKLTPGLRWPVRSFEALIEDPPGVCIVGAPNYADQLVQRAKALCRSQGITVPTFINPFPTPRVV